MYKALIFDLDGTLLNTIEDLCDAANASLRELGYSHQITKEYSYKIIGGGSYEFARTSFESANGDPKEFDKYFETYLKNYKKYQGIKTAPFPHVDEVVQKYENDFKMFVFSNKPHEMLEIIMAKTFSHVHFVEQLGHKKENPEKPNPAAMLDMMKRYGIDIKDCLYIGDSYYDVETAKNANMDCCLCLYGYGTYTEELLSRVKYIVKDYKELDALIASFLKKE